MPQLDGDSQTTVSTPGELRTPHSGGLGGFEFHFDHKPVAGPNGPHLFRASESEPPGSESFQELDFCLTMSPMGEEPQRSVQEIHLRAPGTRKGPQNRPFSSLNSAVAELDESQVRSWSPHQVADWMHEAGFEDSVVQKFLNHDISGVVLLDLQFEDLKELDITSYGKRHRVMSSIHHLRSSSLLNIEPPQSSSPAKSVRPPPVIQRQAADDDFKPSASQEDHTPVSERATSQRRGRLHRQRQHDDVISPAESVSIVAIEQLLPKAHKCSKGEDCQKWQKRQRKLQRLQEEFSLDSNFENSKFIPCESDAPEPVQSDPLRPRSDAEPSVVASSDILGPCQLPEFSITPEKLCEIKPRDPQENVRQFLSFQHCQSSSPVNAPSPPPASSASFVPAPLKQTPLPLAEHLRNLPKLTIPIESSELLGPFTTLEGRRNNTSSTDSRRTHTPATILRRSKTPISVIHRTSQSTAQTMLESDPYHYGGVASPADMYRNDTPFSATDIPVTIFPSDLLARDISQSVPPDMRYGGSDSTALTDSAPHRNLSMRDVRKHRRQNSFTPSIAPLPEVISARPHRPEPPVAPLKLEDIQHSGWMRKRKTTKLLRHEWQDYHFALKGTRLAMQKDAASISKTLEHIDVDDYAIACSSLASSSKLSAAFKRSILGSKGFDRALEETAFAFSLIPYNENRKLFATSKTHHFSVKTRDQRIDWMREIMLAKALKRGKAMGNEVRLNGNLI